MSVFRRRGIESEEIKEIDEPLDRDAETVLPEAPSLGFVQKVRVEAGIELTGPFDVSQVDDDTLRRIDFGSLLIPAIDGMQVRIEVDDQENVVAVSVMLDDTAIQLQAFAAPRSEELWDEVRQEIAEGVRGSQGKAREADGTFGRELMAEVVVNGPDGTSGRQPVRFIGVDGPRWFLRGLISGPGAQDASKAASVESVFRQVAVRRGDHAAPPREPLPLVVPADEGLVSEPPIGSE
ncbi:MAG TPA: DUF3710 domain-containing protein [Actinomycetes bacterium]|nr:DUF3710 domain-containing protein [Actinomycetes bacterium]